MHAAFGGSLLPPKVNSPLHCHINCVFSSLPRLQYYWLFSEEYHKTLEVLEPSACV